MKKLLLVRHAKSGWENTTASDFERTLNDRGKKDAPVMAQRLIDKGVSIDGFISSPAKRAKKTAELFAETFKEDKKEIIYIADLYIALPEIFLDAISKTDDKFSTIAVFSHNPGITDFANTLTDARVDDMPTCSIFAVYVDTDNWNDFSSASKKFWFFDYPKAGQEHK